MLDLQELALLFDEYRTLGQIRVQEFSIGGRYFSFNTEPAIMGVINLSPDSWYRESVCMNEEQAIRRAKVLHEQGAAIVDLGAESSFSGSARADEKTQKNKLIPVIEGLRAANIIVSVETYGSAVAEACLKSGAQIINFSGTAGAEAVFRLAADHDAAVVICYLQGAHARELGDFSFGEDPIRMSYDYFARQIELAANCGLTKLLLDPGLGFYYRNFQDSALRVRYQMRVLLQTFRLRALGFPICQVLPHAFEFFGEEVRTAEAFFAALALLGKTDILRTHEVARTRAVVETLKAY